jgi:2-hydroxychromene-2-carboxylate isomerase
MSRVDFYFDYLSPYAYFAWHRLRPMCAAKGAELWAHPTLLAGLLNHWGQLGPAEIPAKRRWIYSDGYRIANLHGLDFSGPKVHPFNPLPALRLSILEVAGPRRHDLIEAIFYAGWGRGIDLGSPDELAAALDAEGFDGRALLEKTRLPEIKEALKKNTDDAIARGVFGVPTMIVGEEVFWGSDRIDHVALALDGRDPIDRAWVDEALARPKGADRREANEKKR